ncbi:glycosyltransferase family 4 protein [Rhizobium sp. LjRoot254]|uniref:glycosyltransferase family 4 protein n=1 Tax=Rhizobium sp. LjRoot254 TaxID=3342297 RepID=UPI003ECE759B
MSVEKSGKYSRSAVGSVMTQDLEPDLASRKRGGNVTTPIKVLLVHNQYKLRGGEDAVFEAERSMLERGGYDVETLCVSNHDLQSTMANVAVALQTPYSPSGHRRMVEALAAAKPDIVHVHNTFPILSPSIFYACSSAGVPVVHTLHNFRILCANSFLLRDGKICEDCITGSPLNGVLHKCYRSSYVASLTACANISVNKYLGTWSKKVDRFIVLSEFARTKFHDGGIPAERICLKPNFVRGPVSYPLGKPRNGAIYIGRLSVEKGVKSLIEAWRGIDVPLTIVGTGPEESNLREQAKDNAAIKFTGFVSPKAVGEMLSQSEVTIVPSIWNEMFGMTVIEAMAYGVPAIASRIGSLKELVAHGHNGLHFEPGDPDDLRSRVREYFSPHFDRLAMARNAREEFEKKYTEEENLETLSEIYASVLGERRSRDPKSLAFNANMQAPA